MPVNNYFDTVWAVDGDVTTIPDALDPSGYVSFDQGYTANYTSPSGTYPIEREKFNYLMNQITLALQTYQQFGTPPFITTTMNGGTPFSYSKFARVLYGGIVYESLTNANVDTPPSANWTTGTAVSKGGTGLTSLTAHYLPIGNGTSPLTLLAPSAASGIPLVSQGSSLDPAYTTASIAGGGTGATTAAGARTNLGLGTAAIYTSPNQTITASGTLTLSHGLGASPNYVSIILICTSTDLGYSAGDQVMYVGQGGDNLDWGVCVLRDTTNLTVLYGSANGTLRLMNKSTRALGVITNSKWQAVFIASLY